MKSGIQMTLRDSSRAPTFAKYASDNDRTDRAYKYTTFISDASFIDVQ